MVEIIFFISSKLLNYVRKQKDQDELPDLQKIVLDLENLKEIVKSMDENLNKKLNEITSNLESQRDFCLERQSIDKKDTKKYLMMRIEEIKMKILRLQELKP